LFAHSCCPSSSFPPPLKTDLLPLTSTQSSFAAGILLLAAFVAPPSSPTFHIASTAL
jgi:hypothetical protein